MATRVPITSLTAVTSISDNTKFVVVQNGGTFQIAASLITANTSATDVQVSSLRVIVSSHSSTLESIFSYGIGAADLSLVATSIGATTTEWVVGTPVTAEQGRCGWFTPTTVNAVGDSYLTWNSTRKRLRTEGGSVLTAKLVRPNVRYLVKYDKALDSFVVLGLRLQQRFQSRVNLVGNSATLDTYPDDEVGVIARINSMTSSATSGQSGQFLFQVGTSVSGLSNAFQILTNKDARTFGKFLTANNDEVYHPQNPPETDFSAIAELLETAQGMAHEDATDPVQAPTSSVYVPLVGFDLKKRGWAGINNAWFDSYPMRIHTTQEVGVKSGTVAYFYTGTSTTFANRTTNVVKITGPDVVTIDKFQEQDDVIITSRVSAGVDVTLSVGEMPQWGRVIIGGGQSWGKRAIYAAMGGLFDKYVSIGVSNPSSRGIDAAAGASALLQGAATDPLNYWWAQVSDVPGPNTLAAVSVISTWMLANPTLPVPSIMFWIYGLNDMKALTSTGNNTPAIWTASQIKVQDYIDLKVTSITGVSVSLHHIMSPLPSWKFGTFDEKLSYAVRRAQKNVVATDARTHNGPETYDLPRIFNNEHFGFYAQNEYGRRLAVAIENGVNGASYYDGPTITGFTTVSAGEYWVRIERGYVTSLSVGSLQRPDRPLGFGLIPGTSDFIADSVTVADYGWTTASNPGGDPNPDDILRIFPKTPQLGLDLAYPYGSMYNNRETSRIVRELRTLLPLKTWHPSA